MAEYDDVDSSSPFYTPAEAAIAEPAARVSN
jgi:hypothetical protein